MTDVIVDVSGVGEGLLEIVQVPDVASARFRAITITESDAFTRTEVANQTRYTSARCACFEAWALQQ